VSTASSIEWTDATWNPVRGCSKVSAGCTNCYAMRQGHRFSGPSKAYEGLTHVVKGKGPQWTGAVRTVPELLEEPLRWRKPRRVFVNSMSDLFHEDVPDEFIAAVFAVMYDAHRHSYQVLTKRPERMAELLPSREFWDAINRSWLERLWAPVAKRHGLDSSGPRPGPDYPIAGPLPNVWLGTSVEDQAAADERIPHLLRTPATVRFLSCEPLLGRVDLPTDWMMELDWIIVGGESGPGARQCNVAWIRSLVAQCAVAPVPCFVKQVGAYVVDRNDAGFDADLEWETDTGIPTFRSAWPEPVEVEHDINGFREEYQGAPVRVHLIDRKGGNPNEWPWDLRVREFPSLQEART